MVAEGVDIGVPGHLPLMKGVSTPASSTCSDRAIVPLKIERYTIHSKYQGVLIAFSLSLHEGTGLAGSSPNALLYMAQGEARGPLAYSMVPR